MTNNPATHFPRSNMFSCVFHGERFLRTNLHAPTMPANYKRQRKFCLTIPHVSRFLASSNLWGTTSWFRSGSDSAEDWMCLSWHKNIFVSGKKRSSFRLLVSTLGFPGSRNLPTVRDRHSEIWVLIRSVFQESFSLFWTQSRQLVLSVFVSLRQTHSQEEFWDFVRVCCEDRKLEEASKMLGASFDHAYASHQLRFINAETIWFTKFACSSLLNGLILKKKMISCVLIFSYLGPGIRLHCTLQSVAMHMLLIL